MPLEQSKWALGGTIEMRFGGICVDATSPKNHDFASLLFSDETLLRATTWSSQNFYLMMTTMPIQTMVVVGNFEEIYSVFYISFLRKFTQLFAGWVEHNMLKKEKRDIGREWIILLCSFVQVATFFWLLFCDSNGWFGLVYYHHSTSNNKYTGKEGVTNCVDGGRRQDAKKRNHSRRKSWLNQAKVWGHLECLLSLFCFSSNEFFSRLSTTSEKEA